MPITLDAPLWIILLVAAVVLEAMTFAIVSVWFAFGAAAALIAAECGLSFAHQMLLFVGVSGVMLLLTRPLIKKLFPQKFFIPTNAELAVGKTATVIEDIRGKESKGRVKLDGVDWAAISADGKNISAGTSVIVREIRSAKLVVSPADG